MYWFRNAIIYQLIKEIDFSQIEDQLKECEFTPCGSADVSHFGWSAPLATSENLAHQADGRILLVRAIKLSAIVWLYRLLSGSGKE